MLRNLSRDTKSFFQECLRYALLCGLLLGSVGWPLSGQAVDRTVFGTGGFDTITGKLGPNDCASIPCDTIAHAIAQAGVGDTIRLAQGPFNEHDIAVNKSVSIVGDGPSRTKINAQGSGRHFDIAPNQNAAVTISNVDLTGGDATEGGSIRNGSSGTLTLINSKITSNKATKGGGLFNRGVAVVRDSDINSNVALTSGGAVYCDSDGRLTITNTAITDNSVTAPAGAGAGGAIYAAKAEVTIDGGTRISTNKAAYGAGIYFSASENAGLRISDSFLEGNAASQSGGGLANDGGAVTILSSSLSSNSAAFDGGAIWNHGNGSLVARDDTLSENSAGRGGAIFDDTGSAAKTKVRRSTFSLNVAGGEGGAILYEGQANGVMLIVNSTFSGNTAFQGAAAAYAGAGKLSIANSTLFGNTVTGGVTPAAISNRNNIAPLTLDNSIITATNGGGDCFVDLDNSPNAQITGHGNRIDRCGGVEVSPFNLGAVSRLQATLQDNGGVTATHRLLRGSNAIDQGYDSCRDPDGGQPLEQDQRGRDFGRPKDGDEDGVEKCDIGAFEATGLSKIPRQ